MTLKELLEIIEEAIEELGKDAEVRIASQPRWPFENSVGGCAIVEGKLFLAEGSQIGYLSGEAREALGW